MQLGDMTRKVLTPQIFDGLGVIALGGQVQENNGGGDTVFTDAPHGIQTLLI